MCHKKGADLIGLKHTLEQHCCWSQFIQPIVASWDQDKNPGGQGENPE
jgi:hypothetical protein